MFSSGAARGPAPFSQSLSSVLNQPQQTSVVSQVLSGDYHALWESPQRLLGFSHDTWTPPPLPPLPAGYPTVSLDDFKQYLADMSTLMAKFEAIHPTAQGDGRIIDGRKQGMEVSDSLSEELKQVPEAFFSEVRPPRIFYPSPAAVGDHGGVDFSRPSLPQGFALEDPETFEQTGAACEGAQSKMIQERLSHYLDVVEQQLMRQIQVLVGDRSAAQPCDYPQAWLARSCTRAAPRSFAVGLCATCPANTTRGEWFAECVQAVILPAAT